MGYEQVGIWKDPHNDGSMPHHSGPFKTHGLFRPIAIIDISAYRAGILR